MRRILSIFLCAIGISVYAVEYAPFASDLPSSTVMQSVNNSGYMTSGSTYRSTVYEIGSPTPSAPSSGRSIRKAPPGTGGESTYDPNNPQFSPIGDALLPLLIMALAYMVIRVRRKRQVADN